MREMNVPLLLVFLLVFSFVVVKAESAEPPIVVRAQDDNLEWEVRAPLEVKIGEEFSVTFEFHALQTIDLDYVNVTLLGVASPGGGWGVWWNDSWGEMGWYEGVRERKTAHLTAVEECGVHGEILYSYEDTWGEHHFSIGWLDVTEICAKTKQELESDYSSLNQSYATLQKNYDSLEINSNNLKTTMLAAIVATFVFIATTVYFARRRSRAETP